MKLGASGISESSLMSFKSYFFFLFLFFLVGGQTNLMGEASLVRDSLLMAGDNTGELSAISLNITFTLRGIYGSRHHVNFVPFVHVIKF